MLLEHRKQTNENAEEEQELTEVSHTHLLVHYLCPFYMFLYKLKLVFTVGLYYTVHSFIFIIVHNIIFPLVAQGD